MQIPLIPWLTATAGGFIVGGIWYAPFLFGPVWSRLNPMEPRHRTLEGLPRQLVALAMNALQALVLVLLLNATGSWQPAHALGLAFLLWAGFTAAPSLAEAIFSRRHLGAWLVDSLHRLIVVEVMALLLVLLR